VTDRFPASLKGFGFDPQLMASVAESMASVSSFTFIDEEAVKRATRAFESIQPIVAPQLSEALSQVQITAPSGAFEAIEQIPAFNFAKTLENFDISGITGVGVAESLQTLDISKMFKVADAFNLRDLPPTVTADLASQFDRTAQGAVALAEVDEVAAGVEDAIGTELQRMTPAKKRALALNVAVLIGAFLLLAAWLTQDDATEGAGHFLTCAAAYIYLYWLLIGKLDD
jgi:hypothetical protein